MVYEIANQPGELELYIRLVWLFVVIISLLMLCLCYLFLAMRRALRQEHMSFAFSHLVIEGMETERRRIAGELHDGVLPLVKDNAVAAQIRSICTELMPPDFSRFSLTDSLKELCQQFTLRTGIVYNCFIEEGLVFSGMSAVNQLHLFRIIQESFTNIEKHSQSSQASLIIRRMQGSPENILICVSDDGKGMPDMTHGGASLGMTTMRQRAAILGAKLDFISESGNGLMVRVELPPPQRNICRQ